MSLTSELLPEPETPVTQTNVRAEFRRRRSQIVVPRADDPQHLFAGGPGLRRHGDLQRAGQILPGEAAFELAIWSEVPVATTSPPRTPGPGPNR